MTSEYKYFGVPPAGQRDLETRPDIVATDGQTSFPAIYKVGYVDVSRNGTLLTTAAGEFTATDGVTIVLTNPCTLGDVISIRARRQVPISDSYTQSQVHDIANNYYGIATGTGDASIVATNPSVGFSQVDGREVKVRMVSPNTTTTPTINVNGLGAVLITGPGGQPLPIGIFSANQEITLRYNSTLLHYEATNLAPTGLARSSNLTNLVYPSRDGQWRDVYRAGWRPSGFNQQWGGAQWGTEMVDGATGNTYKFDVATGYIEDNNSIIAYGNSTVNSYTSQGVKVGENTSVGAIWLKIFKIGNPTNNLQVSIVADNGSGIPLNTTPISNGTATSQSGRIHTSKTDGEWYRFVFPAPPVLISNTTYQILITSSGATDSSNYWNLRENNITKKYPFGFVSQATSGLVWSQSVGNTLMFLVEPIASNQFLQTGGKFNNKLVFADNNQPGQNKSLVQPMKNFFDGVSFTSLTRVSSAQKGKPIADFTYGLDHDRIQVVCNTGTGYASVNFWDANRTLVTLTSTVDISTTALSDVAVNARLVGDGADYLQLWVNGIQVAYTTGQTYMVSTNFRDLGTAWLGGGFPASPVWTQDMQMTTLPSTQGWTWTGTATEANAMSIQNGKLFQNKNGYASTDNGFYAKTTTLNNATGWSVEWKCRVPTNTNTTLNTGYGTYLQVFDGTKFVFVTITEYFIQSAISPTADITIQGDFKSKENVFTLIGKGNDYYLLMNGNIVIDGTGRFTSTSSTNAIQFGDGAATAGENADVIWSYVKYYQGGAILPQASTGMSLHEYAYWSGDKTVMLPALYAAGTPISVKAISGLRTNYVEEVQWSDQRFSVIGSPSTTSTTPILQPDMEMFVLGDKLDINGFDSLQNNTALVGNYLYIYIDGTSVNLTGQTSPGANEAIPITTRAIIARYIGLHKVEGRVSCTSGTLTSTATNNRFLCVRNSK